MKDKKTGLIQTLIGAIILVIGIVLCVNTYIVKGNKAYAFSLLVTILGIVILIAGLYRTFSKKERKPVDAKVIAGCFVCRTLLCWCNIYKDRHSCWNRKNHVPLW